MFCTRSIVNPRNGPRVEIDTECVSKETAFNGCNELWMRPEVKVYDNVV